jgi:hypothetical protein
MFQRHTKGKASFIYFNTFLVKSENIKGLNQDELTDIERILANITIKEYDDNDPPY